jgi:glyoxylase-like metal-dependent hydrolase (beta-lactamase superfamily II)
MNASWFDVRSIGPGVWVLQDPIGRVVPEYDVRVVNLYLVEGSERAALIDSGMGIGDVFAACRALTSKPLITLCTHSHWDHVGGAYQFAERFISALEAERLNATYDVAGVGTIRAASATGVLREGDEITLGGRSLAVWHTPGHSPGHVSLFDAASNLLFCADTCYAGTLWFQTEDADLDQWRTSLRRLASSGARGLCGGHEEPLQEIGLAQRVLAGLEDALAGRSTSVEFPPDLGARKHMFGEFSILLRRDAGPRPATSTIR